MTNSNKRSSFRRRPFLIVVIIISITIIALITAKILARLDQSSSENDLPVDLPDSSISDTGSSEEGAIINPDYEKPEIIQNEGEDPNTLSDITGVITTSRISSDKFIIRVSLDQYLSSGTCSLDMSSSDKTYSNTVVISDAASTSTCAGFDIPLDQLSSGTWSYTVTILSGDKKGIITGETTL